MRELLTDTLAYIPPARALEGLTHDEAEQRVPGTSHSIAEIVAHMNFWTTWFCQRCEGVDAPMVARAAEGWPAVPRGSWPTEHDAFLASLARAAAISEHR